MSWCILPNGTYFLTGGIHEDFGEHSDQAWDITPELDATILLSMNNSRSKHASIYFNDYIYVFGGETNNQKCIKKAERYTGVWEDLPDLHRSRVNVSCSS